VHLIIIEVYYRSRVEAVVEVITCRVDNSIE
jgi:hypothetical protein